MRGASLGAVFFAAVVAVATPGAAGCASTAETATAVLYRTERVVAGAPRKPGTRPETEPFTIRFEAESRAPAAEDDISRAPPPWKDRGDVETRVALPPEDLDDLAAVIEAKLVRLPPRRSEGAATGDPPPRSITVVRGLARRVYAREEAQKDAEALKAFVEVERVLIRLTQATLGP